MNKCKGCEWNGKPYWSIINPCDNCPRENTNIEILTRWQDPTIEEYKKEISRLNNIIDELGKWLNDEIIRIKNISKKVKVPPYGQEKEYYEKYISSYSRVLDKLKELKEVNNE